MTVSEAVKLTTPGPRLAAKPATRHTV